MRIFVNKPFQRFADKEGLSEADLCEAVKRIEAGHIDADHGGGVLKQRIARPGQGRASGYRSIIIYRVADRAVFVYGFAKSSRSNIKSNELRVFRELASLLLSYSEEDLSRALASGAFIEVRYEE